MKARTTMIDENVITEENTEAVEETEEKVDREVVFEEALEAILFAAGHPISYSTLARVFNTTPAKVKDLVFEYSLKYNSTDLPRGVILLTYSDSCQLCTKQDFLPEIRDALGIRKSGTLSTSSMEVLAIIAYNQPVTRAFVDTLRRVDSSYAMNNLLDRGLIECKGRLDVPGRPMLYGTTSDFLRCFGLKDLASLPQTSDELMNVFNGVRDAEEEKNAAALENDSMQMEVDLEGVMPESAGDDNEETAAVTNTEDAITEEVEDYVESSVEDDINED